MVRTVGHGLLSPSFGATVNSWTITSIYNSPFTIHPVKYMTVAVRTMFRIAAGSKNFQPKFIS